MFLRSAESGPRVFKSTALLLALSVLMPLASTQESAGAAEGPFAGLAGSWSGSGKIMTSSGSNERVRCRATYAVAAGGKNLQQSLRCASDSYNFELRSNVSADGNAISGWWSETTRNVNGRISGRVRGNEIEALVDTAGFSAALTLVTQGSRQSVAIRSSGQELSGVSITLSRN